MSSRRIRINTGMIDEAMVCPVAGQLYTIFRYRFYLDSGYFDWSATRAYKLSEMLNVSKKKIDKAMNWLMTNGWVSHIDGLKLKFNSPTVVGGNWYPVAYTASMSDIFCTNDHWTSRAVNASLQVSQICRKRPDASNNVADGDKCILDGIRLDHLMKQVDTHEYRTSKEINESLPVAGDTSNQIPNCYLMAKWGLSAKSVRRRLKISVLEGTLKIHKTFLDFVGLIDAESIGSYRRSKMYGPRLRKIHKSVGPYRLRLQGWTIPAANEYEVLNPVEIICDRVFGIKDAVRIKFANMLNGYSFKFQDGNIYPSEYNRIENKLDRTLASALAMKGVNVLAFQKYHCPRYSIY